MSAIAPLTPWATGKETTMTAYLDGLDQATFGDYTAPLLIVVLLLAILGVIAQVSFA
jgi:hypothetical protein